MAKSLLTSGGYGGQCPPYATTRPVLVRVVLEMAQIKEVRAIKGQLDEKMSKLQGAVREPPRCPSLATGNDNDPRGFFVDEVLPCQLSHLLGVDRGKIRFHIARPIQLLRMSTGADKHAVEPITV
jgi:hypothetical protein